MPHYSLLACTVMGEIDIFQSLCSAQLGRENNYLLLCSNQILVLWEFLCSGQKWMRLPERNNSNQSFNNFISLEYFLSKKISFKHHFTPKNQVIILKVKTAFKEVIQEISFKHHSSSFLPNLKKSWSYSLNTAFTRFWKFTTFW